PALRDIVALVDTSNSAMRVTITPLKTNHSTATHGSEFDAASPRRYTAMPHGSTQHERNTKLAATGGIECRRCAQGTTRASTAMNTIGQIWVCAASGPKATINPASKPYKGPRRIPVARYRAPPRRNVAPVKIGTGN